MHTMLRRSWAVAVWTRDRHWPRERWIFEWIIAWLGQNMHCFERTLDLWQRRTDDSERKRCWLHQLEPSLSQCTCPSVENAPVRLLSQPWTRFAAHLQIARELSIHFRWKTVIVPRKGPREAPSNVLFNVWHACASSTVKKRRSTIYKRIRRHHGISGIARFGATRRSWTKRWVTAVSIGNERLAIGSNQFEFAKINYSDSSKLQR